LIFTNRIESGFVEVSAGKNIIGKITTNYNDSLKSLTIKNENKHNWARDLNPDIRVYLPCTNIKELHHRSVGTTSCESALEGDVLGLIIGTGNGMVDLKLYYNYIAMWNTSGGITDVIFKGECGTLYVYHNSYAPCDCRNLHAKNVIVEEKGIQNCFISASEQLNATITSYGNIYYYGNPEIVDYKNTGKGKLIQCE
jgi:hypothetical protein